MLAGRGSHRSVALLAAITAAAMALSACSADDIELNGKIFDAAGLTGGGAKAGDPKVAERSPLVMPPGMQQLPQPGTGQVESADIAAIQDPDRKKVISQEELAKQQAEFCKKNYDPMVAQGRGEEALVSGPAGPCRGSVLTAIKSLTGGE